jgi:chitodextrinase
MHVRRLAVSGCAALAVLAVAVPSAQAQKRDRTPPTTPTNLRVVSTTEDSVTVAWDASTDNSGRIHAYVVGGVYHSGTSTTKTIGFLVPNHTIQVHAYAIDPSGNESGVAGPISATTKPDTTPPTAPTNLRVTATTQSTVSLAWEKATDRWSFSYELLMDGEVVGGTTGVTFGPLTFKVRHVEPGTTHRFTVRARDHSGNTGPESNAAEGTTVPSTDRTPPAAPTNLTATTPPDDWCGSNMLQWTASTDDTDPPSAIEYEVYLHGALYHVTQPGATHAFLYTFAGTNSWTVVAVDRAGNSSPPSNAATVTVRVDQNLC